MKKNRTHFYFVTVDQAYPHVALKIKEGLYTPWETPPLNPQVKLVNIKLAV